MIRGGKMMCVGGVQSSVTQQNLRWRQADNDHPGPFVPGLKELCRVAITACATTQPYCSSHQLCVGPTSCLRVRSGVIALIKQGRRRCVTKDRSRNSPRGNDIRSDNTSEQDGKEGPWLSSTVSVVTGHCIRIRTGYTGP